MQDGEVVISGVVFHDANGNQSQDARERGFPNVTVISQAPDAQGGAVNASALTTTDGSFTIQTYMGNRISVVPGAGYKTMQPAGVIVREGMQTLTFPLYVDKVVVDRVIRMEPAAVNVPPPQVYISPLITLPAPVVNVQPANVHIAPAQVVVQPASVYVTPTIDPEALGAVIACISLSLLVGAGLIGLAIRAHARTLYDVAAFEVSRSTCRRTVNAMNWRGTAEQVIADATGSVITIEALVSMSVRPVPTMCFRATNSQVFVFSLGRRADEPQNQLLQTKSITRTRLLATALELQAIWCFFATAMHMPCHLPRSKPWHIAVVSNVTYNNDQLASCDDSDLLNAVHPVFVDQETYVECLQAHGSKSNF
jgi:hypothetical protein